MAISTIDNNGVNLGQLGNRNSIINSNFTIWQRGTSFSSSGYGADRWTYATSGGAGVHSRQAFTGSDIDTFGTQYFHRLAVSTGANNQGMSTLLEDLSRFAGKTVTLSFYAKGTNPGGGHLTTIIGGETGSGGSGDWELGGTNEIVLSSSWQKFTVTMTLPSMNGKTLGTGSYLFIYLARQPNDDNTTNAWTIDMSQVQLELGDTATPFEHRSYGDELAKCHRYFQKLSCSGSSTRQMIGAGHYNTSTALVIAYQHYGGVMRANPTGTLSALNLFDLEPFDSTPTAISIDVPTNKGCFFNCTDDTSRTTGFAGSLFLDTDGAFIAFDAEL
jgi:hypothetical protein